MKLVSATAIAMALLTTTASAYTVKNTYKWNPDCSCQMLTSSDQNGVQLDVPKLKAMNTAIAASRFEKSDGQKEASARFVRFKALERELFTYYDKYDFPMEVYYTKVTRGIDLAAAGKLNAAEKLAIKVWQNYMVETWDHADTKATEPLVGEMAYLKSIGF